MAQRGLYELCLAAKSLGANIGLEDLKKWEQIITSTDGKDYLPLGRPAVSDHALQEIMTAILNVVQKLHGMSQLSLTRLDYDEAMSMQFELPLVVDNDEAQEDNEEEEISTVNVHGASYYSSKNYVTFSSVIFDHEKQEEMLTRTELFELDLLQNSIPFLRFFQFILKQLQLEDPLIPTMLMLISILSGVDKECDENSELERKLISDAKLRMIAFQTHTGRK